MNLKSTLLMFLLTFYCITIYSQRCLTSIKKEEALQSNPQLSDQLRLQEEVTQRWIADNKSTAVPRSVETIPVVVHVIWRESQENISDAQIMSQIEVLNNDFRKLNDNFNTGPMAFQSMGADIEIEFCLASFDPMGNPTNGITRSETTIDNIGLTENWYSSSSGGQDAWNVNEYFNIWVCDLGEDGTLGFATPPGAAVPIESDGAVIAHQYFGTIGTAANSQPAHLGRTATHEVGHYLNLEHIWGSSQGGCNEDDFVPDTPSQETESSGCPTFPFFDGCTSSGNGIMYNNYMDYVDDICMTMFTEGQKMRMLAALNSSRASLLSSNGCSDITSLNETIAFAPAIFPNPAQNNLFITMPNDHVPSQFFIIYNSFGEKMLEFKSSKNIEVDISSFVGGIYFLTTSNPKSTTQKFIVIK